MLIRKTPINYFVDPKAEFDAVGSFVSNYSLLNCVRFVPLIVIYVRVLYPVVSNSVDSRNTLIGISICFDPKRSTLTSHFFRVTTLTRNPTVLRIHLHSLCFLIFRYDTSQLCTIKVINPRFCQSNVLNIIRPVHILIYLQ